MIHLMLHDDWEINGDGSGNPEDLMFRPARRILEICEKYGARYTFFAEVMQQFAMKTSNQDCHREWARRWEEILRTAVLKGHDVQLHIHPQWIGAVYKNDSWQLDQNNWSIAEMETQQILDLISKGKHYLESLLRPVCSTYQVVAFRAGGWMAQPSENLVRALRLAGIYADCTVVPGKRIEYTKNRGIDYRDAFHRALPWWTSERDVAMAGDGRSGVIELPTYSETFMLPLPLHLIRRNLMSLRHYLTIYPTRRQRKQGRRYETTAGDGGKRWYKMFFKPRATYCSFGYIHYLTLLRMLRNERRLTSSVGITEAPLVMLTHSKSFLSFSNFDHLLQRLAVDPGVSFCRTRDYLEKVRNGAIPRLPLIAGQNRASQPRDTDVIEMKLPNL